LEIVFSSPGGRIARRSWALYWKFR